MSAHTKATGHPLVAECHNEQQQAVLLNATNVASNNLLAPFGVNHFVLKSNTRGVQQ